MSSFGPTEIARWLGLAEEAKEVVVLPTCETADTLCRLTDYVGLQNPLHLPEGAKDALALVNDKTNGWINPTTGSVLAVAAPFVTTALIIRALRRDVAKFVPADFMDLIKDNQTALEMFKQIEQDKSTLNRFIRMDKAVAKDFIERITTTKEAAEQFAKYPTASKVKTLGVFEQRQAAKAKEDASKKTAVVVTGEQAAPAAAKKGWFSFLRRQQNVAPVAPGTTEAPKTAEGAVAPATVVATTGEQTAKHVGWMSNPLNRNYWRRNAAPVVAKKVEDAKPVVVTTEVKVDAVEVKDEAKKVTPVNK
jgi:hypothetical protein